MLDREPFLRAIFAAPADDLPRLVFADWLDEHGDPAWAELIRVGCQLSALPENDVLGRDQLLARQSNLLRDRPRPAVGDVQSAGYDRGFTRSAGIVVDAGVLADGEALRLLACRDHPEWYGATALKVWQGPIVTPKPLVTILTSPVTERVVELDLAGREEEVPAADLDPADGLGIQLLDFTRRPTVHPRMVDELAGMRECRRLTLLDLRNNDLDNAALHALAESPYFTRLKTLRLSQGNRFRGRVWQRVLERFGEDVVE